MNKNIEQMNFNKLKETKELRECLQSEISSYKNRDLALKSGQRFKRTPFNNLIDRGIFDADFLLDEFTQIQNGTSTENANTRKLISILVLKCAKEAYFKINKKL